MFTTTLTVAIEHINYANHLAHDKLVTLMHEARLHFFDALGQSELDFYGAGLILKSISVDYRHEAFRGDQLMFTISVHEIRGSAFSLSYSIANQAGETVANAQCLMVGFNYATRRVVRLSNEAKHALTEYRA